MPAGWSTRLPSVQTGEGGGGREREGEGLELGKEGVEIKGRGREREKSENASIFCGEWVCHLIVFEYANIHICGPSFGVHIPYSQLGHGVMISVPPPFLLMPFLT